MVCVMSAVPAETPRTIPDVLPMVATGVLPEDHVPPLTDPLSEIVNPMVTFVAPLMAPADGAPFTVATAVRMHPAPEV